MYPFKVGDSVPKQLPLVLIGCGPDAFIGPSAWHHNIVASRLFRWVGFAPSRDAVKTKQVTPYLDLADSKPKPLVSNNYKHLVKKLLKKHKNLVVGVATETPSHASIMLTLIELGVKFIMVDKPFVSDNTECVDVLTFAKNQGVSIYVTFNHRYNEPIFVLRELASKGKVTSFEAGFIQDWIINPPDCRQAWWRLGGGRYPALTDIGSHAGDLVAFVLDSNIVKILDVGMEKVGNHNFDVLDSGYCSVRMGTGAKGDIEFSQTTPGHADDIYIVLRFKKRAIMWRMEWNCDVLYVSTDPDANIDNPSQWERHVRGHGPLWSELKPGGAKGLLSKNPPGHTQGWDLMWVHLFAAIAGDIHRKLGFKPWKKLPRCMREAPVPTADYDGAESQAFMSDVIALWESRN